jgi:hypothetical protein
MSLKSDNALNSGVIPENTAVKYGDPCTMHVSHEPPPELNLSVTLRLSNCTTCRELISSADPRVMSGANSSWIIFVP